MKKNIFIGLGLGTIAGIIDVIPMIIQKLTWDANISAFTMWIVIGFFLSVSHLKLHPVLKGILTAVLIILPTAVLIGFKEPKSLIPIAAFTLVLSSLLGWSIDWAIKKKK